MCVCRNHKMMISWWCAIQILCSQQEDFGRLNKRFIMSFLSTFQCFHQPSATRPRFLTNLPFHDFPKTVNHDSLLKYLGKSWKGRFVKNGGELPTTAFHGVSTLFGLRNMEIASKTHSDQSCATPPRLLDNLHFEHFDKCVNHKCMLKYLSECSKWRLSNKRGWVAYDWLWRVC